MEIKRREKKSRAKIFWSVSHVEALPHSLTSIAAEWVQEVAAGIVIQIRSAAARAVTLPPEEKCQFHPPCNNACITGANAHNNGIETTCWLPEVLRRISRTYRGTIWRRAIVCTILISLMGMQYVMLLSAPPAPAECILTSYWIQSACERA
jgi:hypothetical protein